MGLHRVMLTPIHDILRSQCKQHNVEEQHGQYQHQNQKQQSLRHSFARADFVEFDPAAAYADCSDSCHGAIEEVEDNSHKQAVVQRKNLKHYKKLI